MEQSQTFCTLHPSPNIRNSDMPPHSHTEELYVSNESQCFIIENFSNKIEICIPSLVCHLTNHNDDRGSHIEIFFNI